MKIVTALFLCSQNKMLPTKQLRTRTIHLPSVQSKSKVPPCRQHEDCNSLVLVFPEQDPRDKTIEKYFFRYDIDESGSINSNLEFEQLLTNLVIGLDIKPLMVWMSHKAQIQRQLLAVWLQSQDRLQSAIESIDELDHDNEMSLADFKLWFYGYLEAMDVDQDE